MEHYEEKNNVIFFLIGENEYICRPKIKIKYVIINKVFEMTKADIVNEISRTTGIEREDVLKVVESFMREVKRSLSKSEDVYLRGFGSFIVKARAEKTARNISKKTSIIIPAHNIPAFKPAKTFMNDVKKTAVKDGKKK